MFEEILTSKPDGLLYHGGEKAGRDAEMRERFQACDRRMESDRFDGKCLESVCMLPSERNNFE